MLCARLGSALAQGLKSSKKSEPDGVGGKKPSEARSSGAPSSGTGEGKTKAAGGSRTAGEGKVTGAGASAADGAALYMLKEKLCLDSFDLMRVVGKGSFGKVYQVRLKSSGEIYALKVLKKSHLARRKQIGGTQTERRVLENIKHPFIVSLKYAFQTEERLYMVLDYFTGGELFFHLKNGGRFGLERGRFYCAELTCALECLHENGIIYRDLKPENVLLDNTGHLKLTDFGLSKDCLRGNTLTHTFCGTPEYLAPEVIQGKPYNKGVDWWSLGTMTYEMVCGLPPFYSTNVSKMYTKIIMAKLKFPRGLLPPEAIDFLSRLLDRDTKVRLGVRGATEVKRHAFFRPINFDQLLKLNVNPPFKPELKVDGKEDVTNVDPEFLQELPKETPMPKSSLLGGDNDPTDAFRGFTYNEAGILTGL